MRPTMSEPCTKPMLPGQMFGEPCEDCGHTNLVHPGRHNPALTECVLCRLASPPDE